MRVHMWCVCGVCWEQKTQVFLENRELLNSSAPPDSAETLPSLHPQQPFSLLPLLPTMSRQHSHMHLLQDTISTLH